ncbi:MAG: sulfur carrier protein ThiS [Clostridiales bacterium]|nr:sulfur carrier protein ThiS [Clostridiales bacterium]
MKITVSGIQKEYAEGLTVEQLILTEKVENPLYVTVTINIEFIKREYFGKTIINDGDVIEFLYFMGGGC